MESHTINIKCMLASVLIAISITVIAQEKDISLELNLLVDYTFQSYYENDITNSIPIIEKSTSIGIIKSYGLGVQGSFYQRKNFAFYVGSGFKYTSMELWYNKHLSSDLDWLNIASENFVLLHCYIPISIYYKPLRNNRLQFQPGVSFEPNLLLFQKSALTVINSDKMSQVLDPESTPSRFYGLVSANLRCSYVYRNIHEVFVDFHVHNAQKYFTEEQSFHSIPVGIMINLGYKF